MEAILPGNINIGVIVKMATHIYINIYIPRTGGVITNQFVYFIFTAHFKKC